MKWAEILTRCPVDRTTRMVTSQRNVSESDGPLSKQDLIDITERCIRKQRLLKIVLGIRNKSQHSNFVYRYNKGWKQKRSAREPRAAQEYIRLGEMMQRFNAELSQLKATEREKARLRDEMLGEREWVFFVSTAVKTGQIKAYAKKCHIQFLSGIRSESLSAGRLYEFFMPSDVEAFVSFAERHGVGDQARDVIAIRLTE